MGSFNVSKGRLSLLLFFSFILIFFTSLLLSKTFLRQWFDPVYMESENTYRILELSDTVDSLSQALSVRDAYLLNIQKIISGEYDETSGNGNETTIAGEDQKPEVGVFQPSEATQSILEEFKGMPLDTYTPSLSVSSSFTESFFFPPIQGVVTALFAPQVDHFGVDVVAKENEPVKSIANGTVVMATWTLDTGYLIGVQHSNELISIYKHNSVILKKIGDQVRGGEIISIIGNTGELTTGPHLHFELWYKGTPLNPLEFITFD